MCILILNTHLLITILTSKNDTTIFQISFTINAMNFVCMTFNHNFLQIEFLMISSYVFDTKITSFVFYFELKIFVIESDHSSFSSIDFS